MHEIDAVRSRIPVVDYPGSAPLAPLLRQPANLSQTAAAWDQGACGRRQGKKLLKLCKVFVGPNALAKSSERSQLYEDHTRECHVRCKRSKPDRCLRGAMASTVPRYEHRSTSDK